MGGVLGVFCDFYVVVVCFECLGDDVLPVVGGFSWGGFFHGVVCGVFFGFSLSLVVCGLESGVLVLMGFGIPFCVREGLFLGWGFVVVLMCVFVVVVMVISSEALGVG